MGKVNRFLKNIFRREKVPNALMILKSCRRAPRRQDKIKSPVRNRGDFYQYFQFSDSSINPHLTYYQIDFAVVRPALPQSIFIILSFPFLSLLEHLYYSILLLECQYLFGKKIKIFFFSKTS